MPNTADISWRPPVRLAVAAIPSVWEGYIDNNYPKETGSSFTAVSNSSTENRKAVSDMKEDLGTDDSILSGEDIEQGTAAVYANSYVLSNETESEDPILLSPDKASASALDVLAYYYSPETDDDEEEPDDSDDDDDNEAEPTCVKPLDADEESDNDSSWIKIEDAYIADDGYVYGTVAADALPAVVAVFYIKKSSYFVDQLDIMTYSYGYTVVGNGLALKITSDEDGNTVVTDEIGNVYTAPAGILTVIAGTVDGTSVDSIKVTVQDANLWTMYLGSISPDEVVTCGDVVLNADGMEIYSFTGPAYNCSAKNMVYNISNSTVSYYLAACQSHIGSDCNGPNPTADSPCHVDKITMNIDNSNIYWVMGGGNSGYTYVGDSTINFTNSQCTQYFICGGSNGVTAKSTVNLKNSTLNMYQSNNRGTVGECSTEYVNTSTTQFMFFSDITDSSCDGTTEKINVAIRSGDIATAYCGSQGGSALTEDTLPQYVDSIKISNTANIESWYEDDEALMETVIEKY